jgi:murein L,D-transpeptidase YafK
MRVRFHYVFMLLLLSSFVLNKDGAFKAAQLRNPRVQQAYREKLADVQHLYLSANINYAAHEIFLRAFKSEKQLELWVRPDKNKPFILLKKYDFCKASGCAGPKRVCGDMQVPEGFYHVNRFNPNSNFYLSLGINYPNASDKILGSKVNTGGDIFIHGDCVSIGCISMTDEVIKEIYVFAVEARNAGQQQISVHIFPARMNEPNFKITEQHYSQDTSLISFWKNIKAGYDIFENTHQVPHITVSSKGHYVFDRSVYRTAGNE